MLERIVGEHKSNLLRRERRTARLILTEFLKIQARLEKEINSLLDLIEAARRSGREISPSFLFEQGRLNKLLAEISAEVDLLSTKFGVIVTKAQRAAIRQTAEFTRQIFSFNDKGKLFADLSGFDSDAARQIIGYSPDKTPLARFFKRIEPPIAERVKDALIYGVSTGQGVREIASEINSALAKGSVHALHIARTETLGASRRASVDFYKKAKLPGYVWMSALDPRTCLVCWRYHGVIFSTKEKPFLHVSCRCVLVPYFGKEKIQTGVEKLARLAPGAQKEILGAARFELHQSGAPLEAFIGTRPSEFGKTRYIKSLDDVTRSGLVFKATNDPARKYYGAGSISHPKEWRETLHYLEKEGVNVIVSGRGMVYGVSPSGGGPGSLRIDPEASISALRHERYHYEHDKARNFPGMRFFFERYAERWRSEFWAYVIELKFAREMKNPVLAREIIKEMRETRKELREFYGVSEDDAGR